MNSESDDSCPKCKKDTMIFSSNDDRGDGYIYYHAVCQSCDYEGYQKHKIEFVGWVERPYGQELIS